MKANRLTTMLATEHPLILGPMGGVSGGRLAAAVSDAGAFGMVGGGYGDADWVERELSLLRSLTRRPWGVGFITWSLQRRVLEAALEHAPAAVMLSFGDARPFVRAVKDAGAKLVCQVQDLAGARSARRAGADVIVAQGAEAGGHAGSRGTLALVPAVVDAVSPVPVVAAGGIADGRGLAAALMLGAQGALLGTRFYASAEALGHARAKARIAAACGDDTERTHVFDTVRGLTWPRVYAGRALGNDFLRRWRGRDAEIALAPPGLRRAYREAARRGDFDTAVVWAGEAVDLIEDVRPAAEIVRDIVAQAEACLRAGREHSRERTRASRHPMPRHTQRSPV